MSEFVSSRGHRFAVGRIPETGEADAAVVAWNDPATGSWLAASENEAGWLRLPFGMVSGDELKETSPDRISLGATFELRYVGAPFYYGVFPLEEKREKAA
jgi:hypothetical protein